MPEAKSEHPITSLHTVKFFIIGKLEEERNCFKVILNLSVNV